MEDSLSYLDNLLYMYNVRKNTYNFSLKLPHLRLVFTNDGIVVEVIIRSRSAIRYCKIKLTEIEAENRFCL